MPTHRRLLVNLSHLAHNVEALKAARPGQKTVFMIKANAYGHGLLPIAEFAFRQLGVEEFGLASFAEAHTLCQHIPDKKLKAYVFSDFDLNSAQQMELFSRRQAMPVISQQRDLDFFLTSPQCQRLPLCLKFNTGMNRLGIDAPEAEAVATLLQRCGRHSIQHLMAHFACASQCMQTHSLNRTQMAGYTQLKSLLRSKGVAIESTSCANSAAIEQGVGAEDSHIRPGLMLYGPSSLGKEVNLATPWPGKMISRLEGPIIQTRRVAKGTPVGYGGHPTPHAGELALIGLGYGDGLATHFSGVQLQHQGAKGKIFGQVNMDMFQILFPAGTPLKIGGPFQVWGEDRHGLADLCRQTDQIPYQILCQLSARLEREYL